VTARAALAEVFQVVFQLIEGLDLDVHVPKFFQGSLDPIATIDIILPQETDQPDEVPLFFLTENPHGQGGDNLIPGQRFVPGGPMRLLRGGATGPPGPWQPRVRRRRPLLRADGKAFPCHR
jgi:hypothetical protein